LIVLAWVFVAVSPSWWRVVIAVPVIGTQFYGLFILGHDAMHRRLFRNRIDNDNYADLLIYGPIGVITRINNKNHLKHHHELATSSDPDRHKHACFNKADPLETVGYLTGVRSALHTLADVYGGRSAREAKKAARAAVSTPKERYTPRDLAILIGWQVALIGGLSWGIGYWAYPALWLIPVFLFAYLADNFRSFADHSQPEDDETADRHRLISYLPNVVERILFSPMNMNYHAVHHLWTSIPYFNLPIADHEVRQSPASASLEWRKSYLGYLWVYLRALPIVGCGNQSQSEIDANAEPTSVS